MAPEESPVLGLTPRQREVLRLVAAGKTNGEIAEELGVSLSGVKWHVSEILSRLQVESREEAAAAWRRDQSPMQRLRRVTGWLALPFAAGVAVGGVALLIAGVAGVIAATSGSVSGVGTAPGDEIVPTPIPTPSRLDLAEAKLIAQDLLEQQFSRFSQSRERGTNPYIPPPIHNGHVLTVDDLQPLAFHEELGDAALEDSSGGGYGYPAPRDLWMAEYQVDDVGVEGWCGPASFTATIVFDAWTGQLTDSQLTLLAHDGLSAQPADVTGAGGNSKICGDVISGIE